MAAIPPPINDHSVEPYHVQFKNFLIRNELLPPQVVQFDGQIHRYGDKPGDDAYWYIAFEDNIPAGRAGCWRTGMDITWVANIGRDLTAEEKMEHNRRMVEAREKHEREKQEKNAAARDQVAKIWADAMPASPDHPYLKRKGVQPHGSKVHSDGRLIVPLYDKDGNLSTVQYIAADGDKLYHKGGATKDCFYLLGDPGEKVFLCEGFATGATIREATGEAVYIAYSANKLKEIAGIIRERHGTMRLVIVADNDVSGVGQSEANRAAAAHGGEIIMPPDLGDVNDYMKAGGDVKSLLDPTPKQWLVQAEEFALKTSGVEWLIKKWIQKRAFMMLFGPSGAGKSFVVLDMAMRLATGKDEWMGHKVNPCPVVYLAGEGHDGLRKRIRAWSQYHKVSESKMWVSESGKDLNREVAEVITHIKNLPEKPGLVIVDTLHRFLDGDENNAQDVRSMTIACQEIMMNTEASVLLVHHTGVSEEAQHRGRGSSAWKGNMDVEINVKKDSNGIFIKQSKVKDSEELGPYPLTLETVPIDGLFDEDGEQITSAVIVKGEAKRSKEDDNQNKIMKILKDATLESGVETIDGKPFISRRFLQEYVVKNKIYSAKTAELYLKPSGPKFISELIELGIIEITNGGFSIIDEETIDLLNMCKDRK